MGLPERDNNVTHVKAVCERKSYTKVKNWNTDNFSELEENFESTQGNNFQSALQRCSRDSVYAWLTFNVQNIFLIIQRWK